MPEQDRSPSCWSSAMLTPTRATTTTTTTTLQATPLVVLRRKLFQQSANTKKRISEHMAKSKHDIQELFSLYYSNDVKFDTFQRQIVTGTQIPKAQPSASSQNNLATSSANTFTAKHFVSREQWSSLDLDTNNAQQSNEKEVAVATARTMPISTSTSISTTTKKPSKRSVQLRADNNIILHPSSHYARPNIPPVTSIQIVAKPPQRISPGPKEEFTESPLVKSTPFFGDIIDETSDTSDNDKTKSFMAQQSTSSKNSSVKVLQPRSLTTVSLSGSNVHNKRDITIQSNTSIASTNSTSRRRPSQASVLTSSAILIRQRMPTKLLSARPPRAKSNLTVTTVESFPQSNMKTGSPSTSSPLSFSSEQCEFSVNNKQHAPSIPSKCSRYVLVSLSEAKPPYDKPSYTVPSYMERLLLPERFPALYQKIVDYYDHHVTQVQVNRHGK